MRKQTSSPEEGDCGSKEEGDFKLLDFCSKQYLKAPQVPLDGTSSHNIFKEVGGQRFLALCDHKVSLKAGKMLSTHFIGARPVQSPVRTLPVYSSIYT